MKFKILFIALLVSGLSWGQILFQDFGTAPITTKPYTVAPGSYDANLNTFSWTTSALGNFGGFVGNGGTPSQSLSIANSSGTPTYTFTFKVAAGYELEVTQFDFWRVRSGGGAQNWAMTINGTAVGSGLVPTTGAAIGATNVASPINGLTGTITIVMTYSGASGTGTLRLDDFTLYGNVTSTAACTTPTDQASAITSTNVTTTGADLTWVDGAGSSGTLVSLKLAASARVAPSTSTNYTPTLNFTSAAGANLINADNVVVAKNATATVTGITGLTAATQYTATSYAYNGSGTNVCFKTAAPESINFYTLAVEPTASGSFGSCTGATLTSISFTFSAANTILNANGYILIYREGAAPTGLPVDGTVYSGGTFIGDSTVFGYIPISSTTATISGLNGGATYYFALIPYGAAPGPIVSTINYRTSTYTSGSCNTSPAPEINVKGVIAPNPSIITGDTTPSTLDNTLYATVSVGGNQSKVFRIENTGNATLTLSSIAMIGGNNSEFAATGVGPGFLALSFPFVIAGGSSFDFAITFSPAAAGTRNTTVTIGSNDANENPYEFLIQGNGSLTSSVEINVKGNGISIPDNSLYPSTINFTSFPLTLTGSSSVRTFTIENLGSTALSLTNIPLVTITGLQANQFSVTTQPSSTTIANGSSLTFQVTFSPTSLGAKNATINIYSNDVDETLYNFNITGSGKGANNIYIYGNSNDVIKGTTTTSILNGTDFGPVAITGAVQQQTFIITNYSGAVKTISNVVLSGPDAADFTIVTQPSETISSSGSSSFTISFNPSAVVTSNATITFTTNDTTDPTLSFAISGQGIIYTVCTVGAIQTIAQQDFEPIPAPPSWGYIATSSDATVDHSITGGTAYGSASGQSKAIGTASFQFKPSTSGTGRFSTVYLDPLNVSDYKNINFSMRVAPFSTTAGQGPDVNDYVSVEVSIDGGVNWSLESELNGYNNSRFEFLSSGQKIFNTYYTGTNSGVSTSTKAVPSCTTTCSGTQTSSGTYAYSQINLNNLPNVSDLRIRLTVYSDNTSEIWSLDNIKIEGQVPQSTAWNGSAWSAGFPTSSTKAIFNAGTSYTTTAALNHGSVQACELQIKSAATVNIDPTYYFEIQSNISNDGNLNVANNGSLVQVNDKATNTGDLTYQRTSTPYERYDYTYWSSPVDTATPISTLFSGWRTDYAFEFKTANFYDVKTINSAGVVTSLTADSFDDSAPWAWDRYTGAMTKGKGYAIMAPTSVPFAPSAPGATVNFKGIPNNGVITLPLVLTSNTDAGYVGVNNPNDDYNLVGNPYPSALYADKFIIDNGLNTSGTLYFWTHVLNISASNPGPSLLNFISDDYALYNRSGGTRASLTTPASSIPTGYIGSGQAFFVEAQSTNELKFNNSMRSKSYVNTEFFRTSANAFEKDRVWLNLQNTDGMFGQLLIAYFDETTLDFDWAYDGRVNLSNNYVSFYSISGDEKYKIQARPTFDTSDIVPLGYFSAVAGEFTVSIDAKEGALNSESTPIYLEDKLLNITHDLNQSAYTFQTVSGRFENRFLLRYTEALGNTNFETLDNSVIASTNHGQLTINSYIESIQNVTVYDILGRQLLDTNNIGNNNFVASNISMGQQALIVKIKLANGLVVTRKIIL